MTRGVSTTKVEGFFVPPGGLMGPTSPAGPTGAGSVVPALAMVHADPFSKPSALPFAIRWPPRSSPYSLSFLNFFVFVPPPSKLGGVPGGPGAGARRLPRACRRGGVPGEWGNPAAGGTLVGPGPAIGDSGPWSGLGVGVPMFTVLARMRTMPSE